MGDEARTVLCTEYFTFDSFLRLEIVSRLAGCPAAAAVQTKVEVAQAPAAISHHRLAETTFPMEEFDGADFAVRSDSKHVFLRFYNCQGNWHGQHVRCELGVFSLHLKYFGGFYLCVLLTQVAL